MQKYLQEINNRLHANKWPVTCIKLAPNAPEQNPVEPAWLKLKNYVRQHYYLADSFLYVKNLFMLAVKNLQFNFDMLNAYTAHLQLS